MESMIEQLGTTMQNSNSSQNAIRAMAELARGIDGLVKHIRAEQADLRIHIEEQGETNKKLRELIEAMLREGDGDRRPN
jgi:C4-type Zn-finger protein